MKTLQNQNISKESHTTTPLPPASLKDLILLLLKKRIRLKVIGHSMEPEIKFGTTLLIKPANHKHINTLRPDNIIAAHHPFKKNLILIKKIQSIQNNKLTLIGINKTHSTDSRAFGPIQKKNIVGLVTSFIASDTASPATYDA